MSENVEAKVLCVENDPDWQERIRKATNTKPGFRVDTSETYNDAVSQLQRESYDVCTLDSRLEDEKPRLSQMVKQAKERSKEIRPVLVAVTAFQGDVTRRLRRQLFEVVDKREVGDDIVRLKRSLIGALRESLRGQAAAVRKELGWEGVRSESDHLITELERMPESSPAALKKRGEEIVKKYEIYRKHFDIVPQVLLDCYGYVSAIREEGVEVILTLPNGQELKRLLDPDICVSAGVHYQDAPCRYTVIRKGSIVSSCLNAGKPPADYPGSAEMPEIDFSVFDELDQNKEGRNESEGEERASVDD